jgi:prefoldin subunit 5
MTCSDLFKNDVNEKLVLNKLKKFREDLIGISTNIQTLNSTLARVEEHSMTLMHVWNDIDKNLIELKKVDKPQLNVNDQVDVINSWLTLKRFLNNYLNTLSDTNVSGIRSLSYNHHPDVKTPIIPSTPNEKKYFKLVNKVPKIRALSLDTEPTDQKSFEEHLSPPVKLQDTLNTMTEQTGKIIGKFNELLQMPWLNSVQVTDPNDTQKKKDLQELLTGYLQKYQKLQADTVPIARKIYSYAQTQQLLLPAIGNEISLKDYLDANNGIVLEYKKEAETVWNLTKKFQDDWQLMINAINQAINELKANIESWQATISTLEEERKKAIILSVFMALGAAIFAAAAFMTGGMIFALIGAGLLAYSIEEAVKAQKLLEAINGYKQCVKNAQDTIDKLNSALPLMLEIKKYLADVTTTWNTIATKLNFIEQQYNLWSRLFVLYKATVKNVISSWKEIEDAAAHYLEIVSKT